MAPVRIESNERSNDHAIKCGTSNHVNNGTNDRSSNKHENNNEKNSINCGLIKIESIRLLPVYLTWLYFEHQFKIALLKKTQVSPPWHVMQEAKRFSKNTFQYRVDKRSKNKLYYFQSWSNVFLYNTSCCW